MSSPLFNAKLMTVDTLKSCSKGVSIAIFMLGLTLSGCDKSSNDNDGAPKIEVLADEVIIDNSLIQTSIPERYQPSYNLEGALIPVNTVKITAPNSVQSSSILVNPDQWVEQGQAVLKIQTQMSETQARSLLNEFTEVSINGVQVEKDSLQTQLLEGQLLNGDSEPELEDKVNRVDSDNNKSDERTTAKPVANNLPNNSESKGSNGDSSGNNMNNSTTTANNNSSNPASSDSTHSSEAELLPVTILYKAPISGKVTKIEGSDSQLKNSNNERLDSPVITLADTQHLQLIGKLPLSTLSQLAVGRSVNFTVYDTQTNLNGQISHIIPDLESNMLIVKAILLPDEENTADLKPGMLASMSIEYGQIELGVRLPKEAIHEASLEKLNDKHPRPTNPLKGFVWVIGHDHQLSYTPIEVVEYFTESKQYLVSGINNNSLIIVADIPKGSAGKTVSVH